MVEKKSDSEDRPSTARRNKLREADAHSGTVPMVSNFFPLERYYEASEKVLESFESAFEKKKLDEAYVYGMRYCTFCVEGITKHDYYMAQKFASRRSLTNQRVASVLTKLERVAEWMDAEEVAREEQRRAFLKKHQEERLRKQRELEQKRIEEWKQRIAQQQQEQDKGQSSDQNIEESALAKLRRLSQPLTPIPPPAAPTPSQESQGSTKKISFQLDEPRREPDGHYSSDASSVLDDTSVLPPPLLPPPQGDQSETDENAAPPNYYSILEKSQLANHSYFGPGAAPPKPPSTTTIGDQPALPSYDAVVKQKPKPKKKQQLSIRQFISQASKIHRDYQQKRKIQVSALKTYQGRCGGSTNGCTVISACVVSKHLQTRGGVTDSQIVSVIDSECVPLLRAIRSKLGLGGSSLIIPSDVHDHLVDHKLLYQHKFVGAAGGNIIDPKHIGELFSMLNGEPGKTQHLKAGATLFFREHVISIVKFPTSPTEAIYDMVDSLPTCNGGASRTRCTGLDALQVHLEWYSSRKFSDSNCTYIERTRWDDTMADFDPRVFQAFVWADLPPPKKS